jgi:hypothetical protein
MIAIASVVTGIILAIALGLMSALSLWTDARRITDHVIAAFYGFSLGALILFILPTLHYASTASRFFLIIGVLVAPLLRIAVAGYEKRTDRPTYTVGGWLGLARVSVLGALVGLSIGVLYQDLFTLSLFGVVAFLTLGPEFLMLGDILYFEGKTKLRSALMPLLAAFVPLVVAILLGSLVWVVLPDTASLIVALAAGTMLYAAVADGAGVALKRHKMLDAGFVLIGAAIAGVLAIYFLV